MANSLPKKLTFDAIVEAALEVRFEADPSSLNELMLGRLADNDRWRGFSQARLPIADIPAPVRRTQTGLRYQPTYELTSADGLISVRIGPQMIAYSRRGKYPGWLTFGTELSDTIDCLYRVVPQIKISRIGLRYVNALQQNVHGVNGIQDLDMNISVAGNQLNSGFNLNFKSNPDDDREIMTRIATADLAQGSVPEYTAVIVDIDVYTKGEFSSDGVKDIKDWVEASHGREKESFFGVLGLEITERLREE